MAPWPTMTGDLSLDRLHNADRRCVPKDTLEAMASLANVMDAEELYALFIRDLQPQDEPGEGTFRAVWSKN